MAALALVALPAVSGAPPGPATWGGAAPGLAGTDPAAPVPLAPPRARIGGATAGLDTGAPQELESEELRQALYGLVDRDPEAQREAAVFLARRGRPDAVPPMVDALRYEPFRNPQLTAALEELVGSDLGPRYEPWAEWVVRQGISGPPGYRRFKADFLARLDPRFGDFLDPERPTTIAYEEIQWGGVRAEGIPSLDDPEVVAAAEAGWLGDEELVFGVLLGSEDARVARAYPLRILDWHEMTNDVVGGVPVALSYCTLCGSGILFDRRLGDRTFRFATSGLLYRSNKLMFDHETESLWSNLTGKPVIGPLVGQGIELRVLPLVVTTWSDWRRRHPDTDVLSLDTGHERDYTPGQPYGEYFASPDLMFPVGLQDRRLPDKAWVFGMREGDTAMAFALEAVHRLGVVDVEVGGRPVVLVAGAGRAVRAYDRGALEGPPPAFAGGAGDEVGAFVTSDDGARWRVTDPFLVDEEGGRRLPRLPGHLAYWFGWYAFFPDTGLWTGR